MEGVKRLSDPVEVLSTPVAWDAAVGIAVNLFSARLFGDDGSHDLNRRAAVIHLLGDAATGIAVGLAVTWTGWSRLRASMTIALDVERRPVEWCNSGGAAPA